MVSIAQESYEKVSRHKAIYSGLSTYLKGRELVSFISLIASFIAVCAQFHLWRLGENHHYQANKASGWRLYQGLLVGYVLHLPGMLCSGFIWSGYQMTVSKLKPFFGESVLISNGLRLLFFTLLLLPYILTHIFPASVVFCVIAFMCMCFVCCLVSGLYGIGAMSRSNKVFTQRVSLFCALTADWVSLVTLIAMVYLYSGASWATAFIYALRGDYCDAQKSWIVFNVSQFSWREWTVLISWFL